MDFKKKVLTLTMTALLGIGVLGVANAATPQETYMGHSIKPTVTVRDISTNGSNATKASQNEKTVPVITVTVPKTVSRENTATPAHPGNLQNPKYAAQHKATPMMNNTVMSRSAYQATYQAQRNQHPWSSPVQNVQAQNHPAYQNSSWNRMNGNMSWGGRHNGFSGNQWCNY